MRYVFVFAIHRPTVNTPDSATAATTTAAAITATATVVAAFMESNTNPLLQVHSLDDSFIELMAMGRIVRLNDKMHLKAASVEGLVAELIQVTTGCKRVSRS